MDKSYQSLYDNSIYSVKLSLNYKKHRDNEREKIRKRWREFMSETYKISDY